MSDVQRTPLGSLPKLKDWACPHCGASLNAVSQDLYGYFTEVSEAKCLACGVVTTYHPLNDQV